MAHVITFVTGNQNKINEVSYIWRVITPADNKIEIRAVALDLPEYQGDAIEIAKQKCAEACKITDGPTLIEDTSLYFPQMNGLPGPYIKWFEKSLGLEGLVKLNKSMCAENTAHATCVFCYCDGPKSQPVAFDFTVVGKIVDPLGTREFGWDAIFEPDGCGVTYGQMNATAKARYSPRYQALVKLRTYLDSKDWKAENDD
jgi:inosine triphosphate pyrophosphatase